MSAPPTAAAPSAGAGAGAGSVAVSTIPAGAQEYEKTADGLSVQHRDVDASTLTPLTPEVISRQATINIGTIGHVAHGKSTTVKSISGVHTVRYKSEMIRNITIKLGYANAKIYRSSAAPYVFRSCASGKPDVFPMEDDSGRDWQLVRHVSFVDCPGHDILMATMLNGAAVMDAAMLLIAANEKCPQPQTSEHLAAVEIMQLRNIIILQNKIDLVKEEQAKEQYEHIKSFVAGTVATDAPVIPISAQLNYNIDLVSQYIACRVPIPVRDFTSAPQLIVIRSFDVNKPGEQVDKLKGGVAGGSILQGVLRVGDKIEVRPGIVSRSKDGRVVCKPIYSVILSLYAERNDLEYAVPGGLIGVGTKIDPTLTRADRLVGQVLGHRDALPKVYIRIKVQYYLLRRLLGVKAADGNKGAKVSKMRTDERLMVNIGSTSTIGTVQSIKQVDLTQVATLELTQPVCTEVGTGVQAKIALSRSIEKNWRLIGWGTIVDGEVVHG